MNDQQFVFAQLVILWVTFGVAYWIAAKRDRRVPADDVGIVFLLALTTYNTLPPLVWLLQDGYYTSVLSGRLLYLQPVADEVQYLLWVVLGYALGFALVFACLRPRTPRAIPAQHWGRVSNGVALCALAVLLLSMLLLSFLSLVGMVQSSETYADHYRLVRELPLGLRQLLKITIGFGGFCQLVLLVAIMQRGAAYRKWIVGYALLLLLSYDSAGSRAQLILGLGSILVAWHLLVRPIRTIGWAVIGASGLVAFTFFGLVRSVGGWNELATLQTHDILTLGEFEALWANGVELLQLREGAGVDIPLHVRFNEFVAFVPSQVLPMEKLSIDIWFLDQFHRAYRDIGGGWAFGAVAQAVVGDGIPEAVLRGMALGAVCIALLTWVRRRSAHWWVLPLYLYVLVSVYHAVRSSTFAQLSDVIQIALPCLIFLGVGGHVLQHSLHAPVRATTT